VGRHLINPSSHGIAKNSHKYQHLFRLAKPYTRLAEMEGNLAAPVPPIMEQQQDSSPSSPLSATLPPEDPGNQWPPASVSASPAHHSAKGKESGTQPPPASASAPGSTPPDSQPARATAGTPSAAVPGSSTGSHQGSLPSAS